MKNLTDQQLFELTKQDNETAFKLIYDRYWDRLYALAIQKTGSPEDSSDIVQELFLEVWKKRSEINLERSLCGYLFVSLKNKTINFIIRRNYQKQKMINYSDTNNLALNIEEVPESRELEKIIHKEIQKMPKKMRTIFNLSREYDLPSNKIAGMLTLSDQTVRNQISKAIKRIKVGLINYDLFFCFLFISTVLYCNILVFLENQYY